MERDDRTPAFCWLRSGTGWLDTEAGREGIGSLLKRDVQLLEMTASSSPRTFGGWSGSDYFSVADQEQLQFTAASFPGRGCGRIFLRSDTRPVCSSRQRSDWYPSWNKAVVLGCHFDLMRDIFLLSEMLKSIPRPSAVPALCGICQSQPRLEPLFLEMTVFNSQGGEREWGWKFHSVPYTCLMAACCQLPHSFQCTNNSLRLIVVSGFDYVQVLFYSNEFGNLSPSGRASTVQPLAHNKQTMRFPPRPYLG